MENQVNAAIYGRVSTDDQVERQTIQNQLMACRAFCEDQDWSIAGEYTDEGISGSIPFVEREWGAQLLEDARAGKFSVVLVVRLDRLSRDVVDALVTYRRMQALKVEVKSLSESFDDTPAGQFTLTVMSGVAQLERALIGERTKAGKKRMAGEGRYVGGTIPLGYVLDPESRHYRIYEPHAHVVRDIFRLYLELGSHLAVAKRLLTVPAFDSTLAPGAKFRPSPSWYRRNGFVPLTARWVRSVIDNDTYLGRFSYGTTHRESAHPAIIDPETFTAAQSIAQLRRKPLHDLEDSLALIPQLDRNQHA